MLSRVAVIDYGMGNLHSVAKALEHVADGKHEVIVTADPQLIRSAERIVFPGVGAIRDCMAEIRRLNIDTLIKQAVTEKPVLAVCVGMQALMQHSEENNGVDGIGVFSGTVRYFGNSLHDNDGIKLKVPHMGWNNVFQKQASHPMWKNIKDNSYFYFVHSYCVPSTADNTTDVAGECDYGKRFAAAISKTNVFATQFHPEKSHNDGLQLYKNFLSWNGAV
jgi:glutamine amidotransferase